MSGGLTVPWLPEQEAALRDCVSAGMTAGQAAIEMTRLFRSVMTRSAMIGKARRMNLTWARPHGQRLNQPPKPKKAPGAVPSWVRTARARPPEPPMEVVEMPRDLPAAEIPIAQRCALMNLTNDTCRWPYGDPCKPDFFFCGALDADLENGRPYCRAHTKKSINRRKPEDL